MPVFYPSARLRVQLQLDEGTDTRPLEARLKRPDPGGLPGAASLTDGALGTTEGLQAASQANSNKRAALARASEFLSPDEMDDRVSRLNIERDGLQAGMEFAIGGGGELQERPRAVASSTSARTVVLDGISPEAASIERNGLQEADTCSVTLAFRDIPIDPRSVRAAFIELTIGLVSADDYRRGVGGEIRSDKSRLSLVAIAPGSDVRLHSATRFVGYVDTWELDASEDGDTISFSARDITAGMHDQELPGGIRIDLTLPIAAGVRALVKRFTATEGMQVRFGSPDADRTGGIDIVDPFSADAAVADIGGDGPVPAAAVSPVLKARRGKRVQRAKAGDKLTLWDHINDTVISLGFVPTVRGLTLYIVDPKTFYAGTSEAKRLVYGRNLIKMAFSRKLGGPAVVPTIEIRCADPEIGATRWARWPVKPGARATGVLGKTDPPAARRANKVSPSGSTDEQIFTQVVKGITDAARLQAVARSLFESFGRQEISGSFTTEEVTSFHGDEGNLLDLWPGDAVEMLVAPLNATSSQDSTNTSPGGVPSSLQQLKSQTQAKRRADLIRKGFGEDNAAKLAASEESASIVTVFRMAAASIDWSNDQGIKVSGDFQNFLVAREAPT